MKFASAVLLCLCLLAASAPTAPTCHVCDTLYFELKTDDGPKVLGEHFECEDTTPTCACANLTVTFV